MMKFTSKTWLGKALECYVAGPSERKTLAESVPRELAIELTTSTGTKHRVRELLLSDADNSTSLIQELVHREVIDGAKPAVCFDQAIPNIPTPGRNSVRINKGAAGGYAAKVAEGAEIPQKNNVYSPTTFTINKVGQNAAITNEMMEDGLFDVAAMEIRYASQAAMNTFNQDALSTLLENSGLEHDTAGSNQGIKALVKAKGLVTAAGFYPDVVVMHPDAYAIAQLDYVPAYNESAESILRDGTLPTMAGLKAFQCGVTDTSATYAWDYDTDGEIGMLVMDAKAAGAVCITRPLQAKQLEDPVKDMVNIPVTMRYGVNYLHANATCRVEY